MIGPYFAGVWTGMFASAAILLAIIFFGDDPPWQF